PRGPDALAPLATSLDVLRLPALLCVDVRRDALSLRRYAGAARVLERAGAARNRRWYRALHRHGWRAPASPRARRGSVGRGAGQPRQIVPRAADADGRDGLAAPRPLGSRARAFLHAAVR